jgi:DNA (cytosine-5)-methyltransferase 1
MKLVDLFAGIGGIRLGVSRVFEQAQCVFTSEIDQYAKLTYRANFGDHALHGDITQIPAHDIPDHDLLLAGFPCQPFSQAGLKKGFADTRGTLFFDIERILIAKKPPIFLLENVKQLRGHDKGCTLITILAHLEQAGYRVYCDTLKARDFGAPQNRERLFIVGFLDHAVPFTFPKASDKATRVGDILDPIVDKKYTLSDTLWQGHQRRKRENKLKGKGFGYGLFNADSPYTNTLSARYYKDGSEILIEQTAQNPRKLTPREAARLQGFPDSFLIPVSDAQAYRQFGNNKPTD